MWLATAVLCCWSLVAFAIANFPASDYWAIDAYRIYDASESLLAGRAYSTDSSMLYSPVAVVLGIPATLIPEAYAVLGLALLKLALAVAVARWLSGGSWLAVVLVLTSLPVLNDVMIGNSMVLLTAAMAVSTFAESRRRSGIAIGILAAAVPKPLLAPYFVWLVVYRRRTAEGAIVTALATSMLAAVVAGPGAYVGWLNNLAHGTSFIGAWNGNTGLSSWAPWLTLPAASVVMALTLLVVARASERRSLVWVLAAGVLVAPYDLWYSAVPLLLALPVLRPWPRVYAIALMQPLVSVSVALVGIVALVTAPFGAVSATETITDAIGAQRRGIHDRPDARELAETQ